MKYMKSFLGVVVILTTLLSACSDLNPVVAPPPEEGTAETAATAETEPVTVKFRSVFQPYFEIDSKLADQFTEQTGIEVEIVLGPEAATEVLDEYLSHFVEQSGEIDVYAVDVIWPGILAEHMIDLNEYMAEEAQLHFPTIIENNTIDGKLVAMPFFSDIGLLYYRTDLLEKYGYEGPPETWDELEEMARVIQEGERLEGNQEFWGYVWQGAAYEGLTCDALEWQASAGGGQIIERDGTITVNNPPTIAALEQAAGWIGDISPPSVTGFLEEDSRSIWQVGNAAFMRNWPYAYARGQAEDSVIKDRFAVTLLPSGGARHASTLGGWQLSVSKYSDHPEEAALFVKYMTSPEVQLQRVVEASLLPTIPELYDDPTVQALSPHYEDLKEVFIGGAIARPSSVTGEAYDEVSTAYFTAVHNVLTGEVDAATAMANLETDLEQMTAFEAGAPEDSVDGE